MTVDELIDLIAERRGICRQEARAKLAGMRAGWNCSRACQLSYPCWLMSCARPTQMMTEP
jgi:hypothetical protein